MKELGLQSKVGKVKGIETAAPQDLDRQIGIESLREKISSFL